MRRSKKLQAYLKEVTEAFYLEQAVQKAREAAKAKV